MVRQPDGSFVCCDVTPSRPPLHEPLLIIPLLYGRWSTSGSDRGIAHFLTATRIKSREQEKKEQTNKHLGLTQVQKECYVTLCMCRLTLVWTLAKLSQSYWNADSMFFHWSGPSLMSTRLSAPVSGVNWSLSSPFANSPLLSPFVSLSDWRPLTTSGHIEIAGPKHFVWFRAKTDKGIVCLSDHLHSVTLVSSDKIILKMITWKNCLNYKRLIKDSSKNISLFSLFNHKSAFEDYIIPKPSL